MASSALTEYFAYCRAAGVRPSTIKLRKHWLGRADRAFDLLTATPRTLINWLGEHDTWKPETRKSARSALRSFYAWAVEAGELPTNPAAKLPAIKVPASVPKPAPDDVLRVALAKATDRDRLVIALAAYAGLRRTEIATLHWDAMVWPGLRITGKGGRTRTVPLLGELARLLRDEQQRRQRGEMGTGWRYQVDPQSPYLFPAYRAGRTEGHMHPETVGAILSEALGQGWTGHTLRHRFATCAYAVDRDLLTVQQLLGHSNPQTTARYTAVPQGAAIAAVAGVAA